MVLQSQPELEVAIHEGIELDRRHHPSAPASLTHNREDDSLTEIQASPGKDGTIFGIRRGDFWIIVAVAFLTVVIAGVGGGIAGAFAQGKFTKR